MNKFTHQRQYRTHQRQQRPSRRFRMKTFDPSVLINNLPKQEVQAEEVYCPQNSFSEMQINSVLKDNILSRGFQSPTPIQDQVIPLLLEGKDVVGIADTGTGKTAAFLVPFINKIINNHNQNVLIITPTRELAVQIDTELTSFTRRTNIFSAVCIGGVGMGGQIRKLSSYPQFVIGTPGRLMDLEQQNKIRFSAFQNIVLDEVDRMLDMGFVHDVNRIIRALPSKRQSACFSATLPQSVHQIMQQFLTEPSHVFVKSGVATHNITQNIIKVNGKPKIDVLHDLLIQDGFTKVLVFGRTKWGLEKLGDDLNKRGFRIASIHGNKRQNQRQQSLEKFRNNQVNILLATDVASRGLDIQGVTHVINFDLPETQEDYIHRIGRTGRIDQKGIALTLVD